LSFGTFVIACLFLDTFACWVPFETISSNFLAPSDFIHHVPGSTNVTFDMTSGLAGIMCAQFIEKRE
jgi:hypothetical protein